jgi:hypothetical protein
MGFATDWVYFAGMIPPSSNDVVVSVNPGVDGGPGGDCCCVCALAATLTPAAAKIENVVSVRMIFIPISLV